MPIYRLGEFIPAIDPSAFVHPDAVLIGDVVIGKKAYIGPCAALRGDFGRIIVGDGANVQDTCVMHAFPNKDCLIETDGHIGHGAILHGCTIGENALVGMNAVVMDEAVIGKNSIVAACSFVPTGFSCDEASMVMGAPAKFRRRLTAEEIQWKSAGTGEYQMLARRCQESLEACEPLRKPQANRPRVDISAYHFKPD